MRSLLLVLLIAAASGCTHTRTLDPAAPSGFAGLNARAHDAATVCLADGRRFAVRSVHVAPDVTTGLSVDTGRAVAVPTDSVASVTFRSRGRGLVQGLGIGLAAGAGGAAVGALLSRGNAVDAGWGASVGGLVVAVPALTVGGVAGWVQGSDRVYLAPQAGPCPPADEPPRRRLSPLPGALILAGGDGLGRLGLERRQRVGDGAGVGRPGEQAADDVVEQGVGARGAGGQDDVERRAGL